MINLSEIQAVMREGELDRKIKSLCEKRQEKHMRKKKRKNSESMGLAGREKT